MIKIRKIKVDPTPVYDITVPETSSFVANNIVVHNCAEILLPTSTDRTAVCCLSSLNLEHYDEWKDTKIVEDLIVMLDNVLQFFIDKAPDVLKKAIFSSSQERSLGLGAMGFHSYLQKNGIPFESEKAKQINIDMFKTIKEKAVFSSLELGKKYGEPPDLQSILEITIGDSILKINSSEFVDVDGEQKRAFELKERMNISMGPISGEITKIEGLHSHSGRRNAHLLAVAPNSNSSIILGTSPSIEPNNSNAYMHQTRAGSWPVKNKYLEILLEEKGINNDDIWDEIIRSKGSIQHMDIFSDEEKEIYKTAIEINQLWVIEHSADRQEFICQSQSTNLFFPPKMNRKEFHKVHMTAWKKKVKTLYYVRTVTPHRAENISIKVQSDKLRDDNETPDTGCVACEG